MQVIGCMIQDILHGGMDLLILNDVVIIQNQDDLLFDAHQSLDELCQDVLKLASFALAHRRRLEVNNRSPFLQTGTEVSQQTIHLIIRTVKTQPAK